MTSEGAATYIAHEISHKYCSDTYLFNQTFYAKKTTGAHLQANAQMQTELQRYHAREDEDRKRVAKREDHDIGEEKKGNGSKRIIQFI